MKFAPNDNLHRMKFAPNDNLHRMTLSFGAGHSVQFLLEIDDFGTKIVVSEPKPKFAPNEMGVAPNDSVQFLHRMTICTE
jgi:hypothetical protein